MALLYRVGTGNGSGGDLKPFIINFTCDSGFIGKTVTMEFKGTPHAGETVDNVSGTVASDGTLTLYPMHDGLWKYYATSDASGYHEGTITLEKWGNYPVELRDTPNGATVTPTDDVQTWLHCANVWDKTNLTTIDDVIADTTTLNTLIANENANDYLVRSTTFATDICSNESAMTYIGLNNYCANKLLADSTWLEAIYNSAYFEEVLNVKVPTMTSNTEPSGQVIFSSSVSAAWNVFDRNISTSWASETNTNSWVGYKFTENKIVKRVSFNSYASGSSDFRVKNFKIQASNDNSNWTDLFSGTASASSDEQFFDINNNNSYLYYRMYVTDVYSGAFIQIIELQFYGREEV